MVTVDPGEHPACCDVWLEPATDGDEPECSCGAWRDDPDAARDAAVSDGLRWSA